MRLINYFFKINLSLDIVNNTHIPYLFKSKPFFFSNTNVTGNWLQLRINGEKIRWMDEIEFPSFEYLKVFIFNMIK